MDGPLELVGTFVDIFLHLDKHLVEWSNTMGPWLYLLLFVVIFAETGLVVTPFLPGDSLLFMVGAVCALPGSPITLPAIIPLLIVAGVLGDATNYSIGRRLGPRVFSREDSMLLNKKHLLRAQAFYEKYGGKTIIIARFVPIVRTFAPFVAGIGQMRYRRFAAFNVVGAVVWVTGFSVLGWSVGNSEPVRKNFQLVVLGIIILSVLPAVVEFILERRRASQLAREQA